MKSITLVFISISSMLLMFGCGPIQEKKAALSGGSELLYKYQWNLLELNGQPMTVVKPPYISFEQGDINKINGHTGCNDLSGTVELDNVNMMKFSAIATTKMACQGENIEAAFLEIFPKIDSWVLTIDELSVYQGKDLLAKFKGLPADPEVNQTKNSMLNGQWELDSIAGSNLALGALFAAQKPTLLFNLPVMEVMGSTGCNTYTSALALDSSHIEFINFTPTENVCKEVGEPLFVSSLKQVSSYNVVDSTMLLLMNGDVALMRFVRL